LLNCETCPFPTVTNYFKSRHILVFQQIRKFLKIKIMSLLRVILCIIFPPLAVIDKGCGSVIIVFLLTLCAWVPGVIGALIICNKGRY
jgi:uncharacterized membrane protein YqaE (UPF0057 family)